MKSESPKKTSIIKIKPYDPSYSQQLIDLAAEVDSTIQMNGFMVAKRVYNDNFHAKTSKYQDSKIIFAECHDENTKKDIVCGSLELGIKDVIINGEKSKVGIITALRIHPKYRREGIGSKLLQEIETYARSKGLKMLYVTTKEADEGPKAFLKKQGFSEGGKIHLVNYRLFDPIQYQESKELFDTKKVLFKELDKDNAKKYLESYYKGGDFLLSNMDEFVNNPDYLKTYIVEVEDGSAVAGINVFNQPKESQIQLQKYIFPIDFYYDKASHMPLFAGFSLLSVGAYYLFHKGFKMNPRAAILVGVAFNMGLILSYSNLSKYVRTASGREPRARYLDAFYQGDPQYTKYMMPFLFSNVNSLNQKNGFKVSTALFDSKDPLATYFPTKDTTGSVVLIRHCKNLIESTPEQSKESQGIPFVDPRDY